ncbi:MAG: carbamoyl-phosphate synthase subunit L, partial [Hyphomicrobiales bacterium]|nr:carbamoyl-phosphate synthase subunit L [Hyphomicrobiales bacterium]
MFSSVLIANRGEIALRVARTARRLGMRVIVVHSEADSAAPFVAFADEAYPIGPAPARESYLVAERILDVARRAGAECIHP